MKIEFLDTTLRDGAQSEGISFSACDKQNILRLLDDFGIDYIEGGDPAYNPKDENFFASNKNAKLVAFGSTRRRDREVYNDENVIKLINAGTDTVSIVGKSSLSQVETVLCANGDENLKMIGETVAFLKAAGKKVIFDAEHFFDGYRENGVYALATLITANISGADVLVLCDTNGGTSPDIVYEVTKKIADSIDCAKIGIHAHNDSGTAVASSVLAVKAGATHVQGTFLGFGERCGNANLSTVIANLALKENYYVDVKLDKITAIANAIAEISNVSLSPQMPYVGTAAFNHKAGMHSDAVIKNPQSFEHVPPETVGNKHAFLLSEIAGRSAVAKKLEAVFPRIDKSNPKIKEILDAIKTMEQEGYQFEGADGSFILLSKRIVGDFTPSFELIDYTINTAKPSGKNNAEVTVKACGRITTAAENGNGPVNALDKALRRALSECYPEIEEVSLVDYKVRVLDGANATGALVRVLITSRDRETSWTTVGVSTDIIEASWLALVDSLEYKLSVKGR